MRILKRVACVGLGVVACGALATGSAQAKMSRLVLNSGDVTVAPGTPTEGELKFGPCGTLESAGTLEGNDMMIDTAQFTSFTGNGGGCGEGGPSASGDVTSMEVSANGVFTALGEVTYLTSLPKRCDYLIKKLTGKFTIPGQTKTDLSGTGKRVKGASEKGCKGTVHVSEVEATLKDASTDTIYEAQKA